MLHLIDSFVCMLTWKNDSSAPAAVHQRTCTACIPPGTQSSVNNIFISVCVWSLVPPHLVPQMFDWIMHNKGLFLAGYTEIGNNHPHAVELQTQHNHFAMNCMVRRTLARGALVMSRALRTVKHPKSHTSIFFFSSPSWIWTRGGVHPGLVPRPVPFMHSHSHDHPWTN